MARAMLVKSTDAGADVESPCFIVRSVGPIRYHHGLNCLGLGLLERHINANQTTLRQKFHLHTAIEVALT